MVKARLMGAVLVLAMAAGVVRAQSDEAAKNAVKARAELDAMVQALGGDAWLNMKNQLLKGRIAAFYQGRPDTGTTLVYEFHAWPDTDRIEVTLECSSFIRLHDDARPGPIRSTKDTAKPLPRGA